MPKEFTYSQRPPDNRKEFERRYERILGSRVVKDKNGIPIDYVTYTETTEQKQPSVKD